MSTVDVFRKITCNDVAHGTPSSVVPTCIQFSPDGTMLTFLLPDELGTRQIYAANLQDAHVKPYKLFRAGDHGAWSQEEQLRRERMRLFSAGLTSYTWAKRSNGSSVLMAPSNGRILIYDAETGAHEVYDGKLGGAVDPQLAPDASQVAFVIDKDLYTLRIDGSHQPTRLTTSSNSALSHGLADFLSQEEMDLYTGFWWSPCSRYIALLVIDQSNVPEYTMPHFTSNPHETENHRYPFTGGPNPIVRVAILDLQQADPQLQYVDMTTVFQAHTDDFTSSHAKTIEYYIPRVMWSNDSTLLVQVQPRHQRSLYLVRCTVRENITTAVLLQEKTEVWINLHDMLTCLPPNWSHNDQDASIYQYFVWASERSGHQLLYLYRYHMTTSQCELIASNIGGEGQVDSIVAIDAAGKGVYYCSSARDVTEKHLYYSSFCGDATPMQLTHEAGWHDVAVCADRKLIVDVYSSFTMPPVTTLIDDRHNSTILHANANVRKFNYVYPELHVIPLDYAPGNEAIILGPPDECLHMLVYRPDVAIYGAGPHPAVNAVYGGPHVQRAVNMWQSTADMRTQHLVQEGFVVYKVDNRGSSRKGLKFEGAIKNNMGDVEVADQVTATKYLTHCGIVDSSRVSVFGWSYGGYMAAMCLMKAPAIFKCAVAGAPVTTWLAYDTHYTERYMSHPKENEVGYVSSALMTHASKLRGALLLFHGLIDENVHFRQTALLIDALIKANKHYELCLYPNERHGPRSLDGLVYLQTRLLEFLNRTLQRSNEVPSTVNMTHLVSSSYASSTEKISSHL